MLVKCQCDSCSQPMTFEAIDAGSLSTCPHCGAEARLRSPPIPRARGEKTGDGEFYVWLDHKPEGPLQSDQLLELAKKFSEMGWAPRNLQADAYRATAEVLEAIGEKAQAVEYYECALQMNPKLPVNKRLASLKKALPAFRGAEPKNGLGN